MELFPHDANYNIIGRTRLFVGISLALVLASLAAVAVLGLNFGIDFAGGYEIQVKFPKEMLGKVGDGDIKRRLNSAGIPDARVQTFGPAEDNEFLVLVRKHGTISEADKQKLKSDFEQLAGGPDGLTDWSVAQSGESLHASFAKEVTEQQVRDVLSKYKLKVRNVTRGERVDRPDYHIELVSLADQIADALRGGFNLPKDYDIVQRVEFVGPQVGEQLRNQGLLAVVYALFFILLYIAIRFDFYFSPGAVIALIHDVSITLGVFAVFRLEFNLPAIAALLTLVGYSLNDTIVVYDRIRENLARLRGRDLPSLVNTSINQTMSRTVLTSGTTILVVAALVIFGGQTIRDFSIALLVGIVVGTYSSVAVASPVYIALRKRYGKGVSKSGGNAAAA